MAIRRRVRCTTKDSQGDITHIGHKGQTWSPRTAAAAIKEIDAKTYEYYVDECGKESTIHVVREGGKAYLRTAADGFHKNNLDNLPSC
jgi:hypothetical protein